MGEVVDVRPTQPVDVCPLVREFHCDCCLDEDRLVKRAEDTSTQGVQRDRGAETKYAVLEDECPGGVSVPELVRQLHTESLIVGRRNLGFGVDAEQVVSVGILALFDDGHPQREGGRPPYELVIAFNEPLRIHDQASP